MNLDPHVIQALGWTLLHFLWQGAALAALFAGSSWALRQAAPSARYALAAATLLGMLALSAGTFATLLRGGATSVWTVPAAAADPTCATPPDACAEGADVLAALPSPVSESLRQRLEENLPAVVALWGAGVLLLSLRTFGGWVLVQRFKARGLSPVPETLQATLARLREALRISAPVRLYQSALVHVPTALGSLRPVILVPAGALVGLSASQLELVLAHELAHIRRRDYLV
ncbi:MAG TPA: M56 family metallopeptidase, partial [Vicinamibacteria bacterium]